MSNAGGQKGVLLVVIQGPRLMEEAPSQFTFDLIVISTARERELGKLHTGLLQLPQELILPQSNRGKTGMQIGVERSQKALWIANSKPGILMLVFHTPARAPSASVLG